MQAKDVVRLGAVSFALTFAIAMTAVPAGAATPGTKLWARPSPSPSGRHVMVSPDGSTVFAAFLGVTARDAATGAKIWSDNAGGILNHLAMAPDGSTVFAVGEITTGTWDRDFLIVAFDATTGGVVWSKTYDGPVDPGPTGPYDYDLAYDVGVTPDGSKVFLTGVSDGRRGPQDFVTIGYGATDGSLLWKNRYSYSSISGDLPSALAVSPDGRRVFVTGESYQGSERAQDFVTIAYRVATGDRMWLRRFGGIPQGAYDVPYAIEVSPGGDRVFVTGVVQTDPSTGFGDIGVVAYRTSDGQRAWARRLGNLDTDDAGESLAVAPDGTSVFLTGYVDWDIATISLDPLDGSTDWMALYDGPGGLNDIGYSVTAGAAGSTVFVAGQACFDVSLDCGAGAGYDFATLAYASATGQRQWVRRYSGSATGAVAANSVAANPLGGSVFVTGDGGTVAYAT